MISKFRLLDSLVSKRDLLLRFKYSALCLEIVLMEVGTKTAKQGSV